jgi:carbon starvation protein
MILTLYFWQRKKPILPLFIPMLFIMIITLTSLFLKAGQFYRSNLFLFSLDIFLIVLIIWMIIEGLLTVRNLKEKY